jgi:hypothetical protein
MATGKLHRKPVHFEVLAWRSDKGEALRTVQTMALSVADRFVSSAGLGATDSTQRRAERPRLEDGRTVYDLQGSKRTDWGDKSNGESTADHIVWHLGCLRL